jgi:predicted protein tyrosine phosphatase
MEPGYIRRVVHLSEVACLAEPPRASAAVISITEPGRVAPLASGWGALLRVQFLDAELDTSMLQRLAARGKAADLNTKGFPCRTRVEPIRTFLARLADQPSITELLVHCHAGQRRSAAVARFAAERLGVQGVARDGFNQTVYALLLNPNHLDHRQDQRPKTRLLRWFKGGG